MVSFCACLSWSSRRVARQLRSGAKPQRTGGREPGLRRPVQPVHHPAASILCRNRCWPVKIPRRECGSLESEQQPGELW